MTSLAVRAAGARRPVATGAPPRPRARWERWATVGLLAATAVLYLWGLDRSGWANSFYAAAAQAGATSWKAFLYGASDAPASITVDKPPFSLWPMALSVRVFGLSPWSVLVPQALMGVATVAVVRASVRRVASAGAALLAGAVLAVTPVAVLMFRYDNPDAMLVLLLSLTAAAVLRGIEDGRTRWMLLAGALVGLAFLTKQLEAFLAVPAMGLAWLVAAPVDLRRRLRDGVLAIGATVLAGGWWVALVELVPASARPWIGGTSSNSFLQLTFGYNGVGRITGNTIGAARVVTSGSGVADPGGQHRRAVRLAGACGRGPGGGRLVAAPGRPANRPGTRGAPGVDRVVAGHRGDVQRHARGLARVLHGRARPPDGGDGRHRRGRGLGSPGPAVGAAPAGRDGGRHGRLVRAAAHPQPGLEPVARAAGRRAHRGRCDRPDRRRPVGQAGAAPRRRGDPGRGAGGSGGVLAADGGHRAHRFRAGRRPERDLRGAERRGGARSRRA